MDYGHPDTDPSSLQKTGIVLPASYTRRYSTDSRSRAGLPEGSRKYDVTSFASYWDIYSIKIKQSVKPALPSPSRLNGSSNSSISRPNPVSAIRVYHLPSLRGQRADGRMFAPRSTCAPGRDRGQATESGSPGARSARRRCSLRSPAGFPPYWSVQSAPRSASDGLRQFAQPPLTSIRLDIPEGLSVHARRTAIGLARAVGVVQHVLAIHFVIKRVESVIGRSLRFGLQRPLQLPYLVSGCP